MCEVNIVIPSILHIYVLHWYHTYLLHTGIDRLGAMIHQDLYWLIIINAVQKEGSNYDLFPTYKTIK